jgi:hypothetical protein
MVGPVLPGVLEVPAPLNATLEDSVLLAAPINVASPESTLSGSSLDLDFGVLPCNSLELTTVNNDAEHVVTSVAIPLPPSPPRAASRPQEPAIDLLCHEDIDDFQQDGRACNIPEDSLDDMILVPTPKLATLD